MKKDMCKEFDYVRQLFLSNGYEFTLNEELRLIGNDKDNKCCVSVEVRQNSIDDTVVVAHFCPVESMDRWANSRHISVEFYTDWENTNWTYELFVEHGSQAIKDAEILCDIIPKRLFDNFINIELM